MPKEVITLYTQCGHQMLAEPPKTYFWDQSARRAAQSKIDDYCPECKPIFKTSLPVPKDVEVASPIFKPSQLVKAESLVSRFLRRSEADQEAGEAKAREKQEAREKKAAEREQREARRRERKKQQKREQKDDSSDRDPDAFPFLDEATFDMLMGPFNPLQSDEDYDICERYKEMMREREAAKVRLAGESSRSDLQEPYPDGKSYSALP
jgi:hypothetical protein